MENKLLEVAFAGLIHDIGKFYQRTEMQSDFSKSEQIIHEKKQLIQNCVDLEDRYTKKFFEEILKINPYFISNDLSEIISKGDELSSSIDRNDEEIDDNFQFQGLRLNSIIGKVNLGKSSKVGYFDLKPLSSINYPKFNVSNISDEESLKEYCNLFELFKSTICNDSNITSEINKYLYDRIYASLYEYATYVPSNVNEKEKSFVSLFDHLKLSSAISSCLYLSKGIEQFCMLEFDVSGIQKFIFKVTEGKDTKKAIAKSLRGRSAFISLITSIVTYNYLNEFDLTQSNIIFNTGGGGLILLPCSEGYEEKIKTVSEKLSRDLFNVFGTDISFVYAYVVCNSKELEEFKIDKAIQLKSALEEKKTRKMDNLIDADFFIQKTNPNTSVCKMCGTNIVKNDELCDICKTIVKISDYLVNHDKMYLLYDFKNRDFKFDENSYVKLEIGPGKIYLVSEKILSKCIGKYDYVESINHTRVGNTRYIANMVPQYKGEILNFESISDNILEDEYGDKKLAILKMDVDNLGSIFAYGLSKTRSLSKYLTLSRLMELFFNKYLEKICIDVSKQLKHKINVKNDNIFYINYSGGDDLVIIGPAVGILLLAKEINNKLKEFTQNENITISGGVHIQNPKEPIRFGIKKAEENLSSAKMNEGKNSITLVNTTCTFSEYEKILSRVNDYVNLINMKKISRSIFYELMLNIDCDDYDIYLRNIPKIFYSLKRNVSDKLIEIELTKDFSSVKSIYDLKIQVLKMKLAIMQTREDK